MNPSRKIRVLIVDDSAFVRKVATDTLAADPGIEVVGTAADPYEARDRIRELQPDVVTLDLEMPRMDGLTFLRLLMEHRPLPVIVLSSLSQRGSDFALEALRLGAVDVLGKPSGSSSFGNLGPQLIAMVKTAAVARIRRAGVAPTGARALPGRLRIDRRACILLGASTGGPESLREVLTALPAGLPGIAIVQHIPAGFSRAYADRLNGLCAFPVREAVDGERLDPNMALLAPGNFHLMLAWQGDHYRVRVVDGPQIWHQRPAVDLLFKSAADCGAGPHAIAGVLTGMGKDGAEGLLRLREKGASTFAQDEASCIVYGMPKAAWENGGAQRQLPLDRMAAHLTAHFLAPLSHSTPPTPAAYRHE
ncbi:Chemotaxis response regulator protein-glutamate methylesterase [Lacunisphaera limnophila]|uniref:Protein-glutamate methylesterase/protein-glutamine glutaminase n=1 Tax=Lacunisphaera limnophila TaxID=1838286 RepID=A0A1D8AW29_9BACT|nr:chemotaxis response regulator protein-glutamate methylesterase [Lacunisphaera limnophila]AOS45102.1 Chemotaxis response regulator protein-glutamate methylesterase [Lacunisphaera limnophila]